MHWRLLGLVLAALPAIFTMWLPTSVSAGGPMLQLPWPTQDQHNINGGVNGGYNYGCGTHSGSDYYALDFNLVYQTVAATAGGIVSVVDRDGLGGYGRYVLIAHPNGFSSRYAHLETVQVYQGQYVKQGQTVGVSGATGNSTGPHLHWVAYQYGAAFVPEPSSWYTGFDNYGATACGPGQTSPMYRGRPPANEDFSGDGCADITGRLATDQGLYLYTGTCGYGLYGPALLGTGWSAMNWIFGPGGWAADGCPDVLAKDYTGIMWWYYGSCAGPIYGGQVAGFGWNMYDIIMSPRDFSGDGCPDVLARRPSDDTLQMYTGNCQGGFSGGPIQVGNGWNSMTAIVGVGDWDQDGCSDVLGRTSAPYWILYLYRGNCSGGFLGATSIGAGFPDWWSPILFGPGDFDNDQCPDLAIKRNDGNVYLYRGGCGVYFMGTPPVTIGYGFGNFNILY